MSTNIIIRCSETEKAAIKFAAEAAGKTMTDFILDLVAPHADFERATRPEGQPYITFKNTGARERLYWCLENLKGDTPQDWGLHPVDDVDWIFEDGNVTWQRIPTRNGQQY